MGKTLLFFLGILEAAIGCSSISAALLIYFNLFGIGSYISLPSAYFWLCMLAILAFGLVSIAAGVFMINEARVQV